MADAVISDRAFDGPIAGFLDRFNREVIPFIRRLRKAIDAATATLAPGDEGQALITTGGEALWGDDFASQNLTTKGSVLLNSATAFLRLGLAAGSGVGSAAAIGTMRVANGFFISGRGPGDTTNTSILTWLSSAITVGQNSFAKVALSSGLVQLTATNTLALSCAPTASTFAGPTIQFANGVAGTIGGSNNNVAAGDPCMFRGGDSSFAGGAGGLGTFRGGDGGVSGNGAPALIRGGARGPGPGGLDGNVALHAVAANFQAMEGGVFIGNARTAPTGDPTAGYFLYADGTSLKVRGPSGTITTVALA